MWANTYKLRKNVLKEIDEMFCNEIADKDIDRWISNFNTLNKRDFFHLIKGEHTLYLMIKTLDAILIFNILFNAVNNVLPPFIQFRQHISTSKKEIINAKN